MSFYVHLVSFIFFFLKNCHELPWIFFYFVLSWYKLNTAYQFCEPFLFVWLRVEIRETFSAKEKKICMNKTAVARKLLSVCLSFRIRPKIKLETSTWVRWCHVLFVNSGWFSFALFFRLRICRWRFVVFGRHFRWRFWWTILLQLFRRKTVLNQWNRMDRG